MRVLAAGDLCCARSGHAVRCLGGCGPSEHCLLRRRVLGLMSGAGAVRGLDLWRRQCHQTWHERALLLCMMRLSKTK